jgi:hypothetical protein
MISPTLKFLILRIIAYVVVTISYTKHNVNVWLLILLFLIIEINVWITFFANRQRKKSDVETKKLLEDMRDNLLKKE